MRKVGAVWRKQLCFLFMHMGFLGNATILFYMSLLLNVTLVWVWSAGNQHGGINKILYFKHESQRRGLSTVMACVFVMLCIIDRYRIMVCVFCCVDYNMNCNGSSFKLSLWWREYLAAIHWYPHICKCVEKIYFGVKNGGFKWSGCHPEWQTELLY